ncbi:AbrB/MazE/SpoVT family DNA-binding domain-containing protein [Paraclostridium bifermentans]|uniref:AbrB/MazE/SpoVT family DNA-binding domain-containing protein n=1 Tax=Paraclostridium bifermentans TaxID=1490 RepID=UPI0025B0C245|nr:AbrB/MazE/SpoVT family DNA-binding domain-containing protein [Paraclostridium bifermentans]
MSNKGNSEKVQRNIMMGPVGKHRPDATYYRVSLPVEMMVELGVTKDDRTFDVYKEGNKIILEKIKK